MRKLIPYLLVFAMATSAAQSFAQQSDRYEQRLNDIEKICSSGIVAQYDAVERTIEAKRRAVFLNILNFQFLFDAIEN